MPPMVKRKAAQSVNEIVRTRQLRSSGRGNGRSRIFVRGISIERVLQMISRVSPDPQGLLIPAFLMSYSGLELNVDCGSEAGISRG
jgi:hypothetical protein